MFFYNMRMLMALYGFLSMFQYPFYYLTLKYDEQDDEKSQKHLFLTIISLNIWMLMVMMIIIHHFRVNQKIIQIAFHRYYKSSQDFSVVMKLTKKQLNRFEIDPKESFGTQLKDKIKNHVIESLTQHYSSKSKEFFEIAFITFGSTLSSKLISCPKKFDHSFD